jgi:hypothetical protein
LWVDTEALISHQGFAAEFQQNALVFRRRHVLIELLSESRRNITGEVG